MSKVKPYLFILLTVLAVSFIAGCSDSDDDSGVAVTSVTIEDKLESVVRGNTYQLTAKVEPENATNKEITWSSSNPEAVSVDDNGKVSVEGYITEQVTITASSKSNPEVKDEWTFAIYEPITSEFTKSLVPLEVGNSYTNELDDLEAVKASSSSITYVSSNTGVVTVNEETGEITGVSTGSATITATIQPKYQTDTISKTYEVQVLSPSIPVGDIASLEGTYEILFFYTDGAEVAVLTTDCSKVEEYAPGKKKCDNPETDSLQHYGRVTMKVNNNGSIKMLSKMQMNGERMKNPVIAMFASGNTFNFNEFPTIPSEAISSITINNPLSENYKIGVPGRNAEGEINEKGSTESSFYLSIEEDGTVVNHMTDNSVMPANVVIRMKKISDELEVLDPNTSYNGTAGAPDIDNFNNDLQYELKNN